eukprot:TRINITY_DN30628_c0_g1_i1.p1 TRINITY_DN30628_c0_g1~~TRINITY_DN30628_c0_g1_i1.p1  ORF type:complete len:1327 (-),score=229.11 TRINITY_DN30628_c0_g1_i1:244-4224(-)
MAADPSKFRFCIDRGGTFTDVYAEVPTDGSVADATPRTLKLLSEDPANYPNAPREGIRRILEQVTGKPHPRDQPLDASAVEWIRMGTTVATNALLEREGARTALIASVGFGDLLEIGNQARPEIFDIMTRKAPSLYEAVVEAKERVRLLSKAEANSLGLQGKPGDRTVIDNVTYVNGTTDEWVEVRQALDENDLRAKLQTLKDSGIEAVAFAFVHSYTFGDHELAAGKLARQFGFKQVSVSSELLPMVRMVPRGQTAVVDAYLTPFIRAYLDSFTSGFKTGTLALGPGEKGAQVSFMQSDGGLTAAKNFCGFKAILSGPAGGVVGYAVTTTRIVGDDRPIIGFDMGGTSTDVSRYAGHYEQVFETTTAGVKVLCPQLDINTVAAGGGSRLFFRTGAFVVGPESSKAHPGPVCYRKNGYLAVTDANLFLGRLLPQHFPKIFGPKENQPLDVDATADAIRKITADVNAYYKGRKELSPEQVASGFLRVANETMCRPIRELSEARGFNPREHVLACFGGAAAQHVCAVARALGMSTAVVHRYSGILSAYGMGLADVVVDKQEPCAMSLTPATLPKLKERQAVLSKFISAELTEQGFPDNRIELELYLNLCYEGTDNAVMVKAPEDGDYVKAMRAVFKREYGFELSAGRTINVEDVRVRGVGKSNLLQGHKIGQASGSAPPAAGETTKCYFDDGGWLDTPVYILERLLAGHQVPGPSIIMNGTSTIVVEPSAVAHITEEGDVRIELQAIAKKAGAGEEHATEVDPIQLSVFSNRFMSIAEQMGRTLQRTSTSVNIKERLDFSCAIFGPDGGLVANAPHVPVHLGAMADTVRCQVKKFQGQLKSGDVIVANHPASGGSHLPDITVITPVFAEPVDGRGPLFYCASRGHHADIGGSTPGSMPSDSRSLLEEGAVIDGFLLVKKGVFDDAGITELLMAPAKVPRGKLEAPLSGCRNLVDVVSDLKAQVAANAKGIAQIHELIRECSEPLVIAYMRHVQDNAAACVREMLREFAKTVGLGGKQGSVYASEYMDDGTEIKLKLTVDGVAGTADFDFTGTGPEVLGNWNAPTAITSAALIYCLRLLVGKEIPLNSGCMEPVSIKIPTGSVLSPSVDAAVCAGNVLTSMRVTDVILKAFKACAASQGCMNNFTFGDASFGYYETIAGGAGAGPSWHGTSAVQCHMTNTRMTDVEIMERRYPVLLREFSIRTDSGGEGKFQGGEGVAREIEFLRSGITASLLCERRVTRPYGLCGGGPGGTGLNLLFRKDGSVVNIGAKNKVTVTKGDRIRILTPGGGGYGEPNGNDRDAKRRRVQTSAQVAGSHTASTALSSNAVEF